MSNTVTLHATCAWQHERCAWEVDLKIVTNRSVKDRIALNMINRAEQEGLISPGSTTLVRQALSYVPKQLFAFPLVLQVWPTAPESRSTDSFASYNLRAAQLTTVD